jgi:hypothetical protein
VTVTAEYMYAALLASRGAADVRRCNPFLDDDTLSQVEHGAHERRRSAVRDSARVRVLLSVAYVSSHRRYRRVSPLIALVRFLANPHAAFARRSPLGQTFDLAVAIVLHASRVGHVNRCLSAARELQAQLRKAQDGSASHRPGLALKAESLAEALTTKRTYVDGDNDHGHFQTAAATAAAAAENSAVAAATSRGGNDTKLATYDPRFLVFEFTWNIVLRRRQVGGRPPSWRASPPPRCRTGSRYATFRATSRHSHATVLKSQTHVARSVSLFLKLSSNRRSSSCATFCARRATRRSAGRASSRCSWAAARRPS